MTLSSIRYHAVCLLSLAALLAGFCRAQSGRAELFGVLRDSSGLPIPAATAELREAGTGARRQTLTGADGAWHFAALPPGVYDLELRKPQFQTLKRIGVQ